MNETRHNMQKFVWTFSYSLFLGLPESKTEILFSERTATF